MQRESIAGFRLSPQQAHLWALQEAHGAHPFRAQCAVQIDGSLDVTTLKAAIENVVARHEILRTAFQHTPEMNVPVQVIADEYQPSFQEHDLSGLSPQEQTRRIEQLLLEERSAPLNLDSPPLLQTSIVSMSPDEHVLILNTSALSADLRTLQLLVGELSRSYAACLRGDGLGDEPMQYADLAEWQNELLESEDARTGREYWQKQNFHPSQSIRLPFGKQTRGEASFEPRVLSATVPPEVHAQLRALARRHQTDIDVILLACWQVLLRRLSGQAEIVVRKASDGRTDEEVADALGLFTRYLPLRVHLRDDCDLGVALQQVRQAADENDKWQACFSWQTSVETGDATPRIASEPFAFDFTEQPAPFLEAGLTFSILKQYACVESFNLKLSCLGRADALDTEFHYDARMYTANEVERLARQFQRLLESVTSDPEASVGEWEIVGDAERRQLLGQFNSTEADYPREQCIHRLFEEHAERHPEQVAVIAEGAQLTYGELNSRANQVAHRLQLLGVGAEVRVGLFMERSPEIVVALLGILKAGGAYVPLDPSYPLDRLASMLNDAQLPVILTEEHLQEYLPTCWAQLVCIDSEWEEIEAFGIENPSSEVMADNTAYVIYTSGTTGQPKGVVIEHRGVANLVVWQAANYGLTTRSRISQFASYGFDAAVGETFMALLNGATLFMLSRDNLEPERLINSLNENSISVCVLVPSMLKELDPSLLKHGTELTIVAVGETCPPELALRWSKFCNFMNAYGPTEYTVYSHLWRVSESDAYESGSVPIGTPIHNSKSYILDAYLNPVPIGVTGEIYISGPGIARGYLNHPDLTAESFLPNDFAHECDFTECGMLLTESVSRERAEFKQHVQPLRHDDNGKGGVGRNDPPSELIFQLVEQLDADLIKKTRTFVQNYCQERAVYQAFCRYLFEGFNGSYASCGINREVLRVLLPYESFEGLEGVDFGFGNAEVVQSLSRLGARMQGLDFNPFFVQKARGDGLNARMAKIDVDPELFMSETEIPAGSQDFAISTLLLDRLERPKNCIENLLLALKEGGRFAIQTLLPIVGVDDGDVAEPIVYTPEEHRITPGRNVEQDKLSLIRLLHRHGARDLKIYQLPYTVVSRDGIQDYTLWSFAGCKGRPVEADQRHFERMYKTGDLGRYLPDGNIEFRGRVDNQIKIRGFRIELGDIEAALSSHHQLKDSLVIASENEKGVKRLVAYVVAAGREVPSQSQLQSYLREKLPEYMIPSVFVTLEEMPLTPNGKVDRKALPSPEQLRPETDTGYVAPQTPVEEVLVNLWAEVLGIERVGVHDNFFDLGGHSLLGTQLISRMREVFQAEFWLRHLFEQPTVAALAQKVEAAQREGRELNLPPIVAVSRDEELPASFSQQRQWVLDQFDPGSSDYNLPTPVRLRGHLDIAALERTLSEIIRRHESLRTTFAAGQNGLVQIINPPSVVELEVQDLSDLPGAEREAEAVRLVSEEAKLPFDLARGPLMRTGLLRLDAEDHVLLLTMHHIVNDGWSQGILIRELAALYEAFSHERPSPLPELSIQYADYAHWQRLWLPGEVLEKQLSYWKQKLDGVSVLQLPTDRPRPPIQTFAGAAEALRLSRTLTPQMAALSRQEGCTSFMCLLAAFKLLLSRYTGQDDICVGTFIANRNRVEIENLVGFFVNNLSLRTDLSGVLNYRELLRHVREVTLGAYAHQDAPFERVLDELQPERDLSRTPLFQVMFVLQNAPVGALEIPGLSMSPLGAGSHRSNFDLTLWMSEVDGEVIGDLQYNTDLFDADTIKRMARQYEQLVETLFANPDQPLAQLSLLSEAERQQVLTDWNDNAADYPQDRCLHELFEMHAERTPEAVALAFEGGQLTYGELNRRANQLAHRLRAMGVGAESLVGLCLERSVELGVGILGVLKAGGGYVPLDPEYPAHRISFMLEDARVSVLLTQQHLADALRQHEAEVLCLDAQWSTLAQESEENPSADVASENIAYVIYTSGSTGRPKGVLISHRSVINHGWAIATRLNFRPSDRILQFHSISFDAAVEEFFPTWFSGGALFLPPERLLVPDTSFLRLIERNGLTVVNFPIPYWHEWVKQLSIAQERLPACLRLVIVGSERTSIEHFRTWQKLYGDDVQWVNTYGPTEATVSATLYDLPESVEDRLALSEVPIGRPIANAQAFILDRHLQPVAVGVAGELYLGGDGVARGYLARPEQTAEKFIPNPFAAEPGARLYRTGDLARYRPDGNVNFVGRLDHQVKVRGFRIELGEIETELSKYPGVSMTLVVVREDAPGEKRIVAYVVSDEGSQPAPDKLRAYLQERIPEYMLPAAFVILDALPLTPNGKVDRGALPAPEHARQERDGSYTPPRNSTEEQLVAIWSEVLGVRQVGVHDNFFELGGDSILSIQVVARANQTGLRLTPKQIFEHRTVAKLATVAGTAQAVEAEQGIVTGALPLTPIQHWFFEQDLPQPHHWNMAVLLKVKQTLDPALLREAVAQVVAHHDALRLRFTCEATSWRQVNAGTDDAVPFSRLNLEGILGEDLSRAIEEAATQQQSSLNLTQGPLLRVMLFECGGGGADRLLIVAHHLTIDGVSWRVILEDLQAAYTQLSKNQPVRLAPKTTSFKHWSERLTAYAQAETLRRELPYWLGQSGRRVARLPVDHPSGGNTEASARSIVVKLGAQDTEALLHEISAVYHTQINDLLLTAFAQMLARWTGEKCVLVNLEGHGREDVLEGVDISRSVGWFTTLSPLVLQVDDQDGLGEALKSVKEQLRDVPQHGIGYGVLRYLSADADLRRQLSQRQEAEISFNYLGQFKESHDEISLFTLTTEARGPIRSLSGTRRHLIEVVGMVTAGELQLDWTYSANVHRQDTIAALAEQFLECLRQIIRHCQSPAAGGFTPSDFPLAKLNAQKLDKISALLNMDDLD